MGHLIDPPQRVEGEYVAIFAQTGIADHLALSLLRERGFDARPFPLMGDLAFESFGGMLGGSALFGGESLVCVPARQADAAIAVLLDDSGLIDDGGFDDGNECDGDV